MRAGAYLRLYRVKDWVHFLPLPFAGWIADPDHPGLAALAGGVLAWGLGLAYTSAINQAFDERVDRMWKAKNPVGAVFDRPRAILLSLPPLIASLAVLAWLSPAGLLAGVALVAAATLYSAPPRLKRFAVLGTLWNVLVAAPGFFFAGRPSVADLPLRPLIGLFAVLLLGSQLIHEAQDRDDDVGEVRTVATEGGRRMALLVASALIAATPAIAWWLAAGVPRRVEITVACAMFAAGWGALLWTRTRCEDPAELKLLRLRYRYSAIALGAVVFAAMRV